MSMTPELIMAAARMLRYLGKALHQPWFGATAPAPAPPPASPRVPVIPPCRGWLLHNTGMCRCYDSYPRERAEKRARDRY